jgi:general secretion pathway protein L
MNSAAKDITHMKPLRAASDLLEPWTGSVATAITSVIDRAMPPRIVRVVEQGEELLVESDDGKTVAKIPTGAIASSNLRDLLRGAKVELMLDPNHCVFRPVEVPARAADFLEGIVRAQIDRLTPWNANEAVFGCSPPVASSGETITTIVAFTTRKTIDKYVGPLSTFHPAAISVWTRPTGHDVARLKLFEQNTRQYLGATRLNRGLKAIFGLTGLATLLAVLAAILLSGYLSDQEEELGNQLSQRRAAIRANSSANDRSPAATLRRRKLDAAPVVLVLDKLAAVLPDNTYVTELHLAENKVQIVGISADSSSLIPLIEQSPTFKNATFFAPTTNSASDRGERFHIEAQILAPARDNR